MCWLSPFPRVDYLPFIGSIWWQLGNLSEISERQHFYLILPIFGEHFMHSSKNEFGKEYTYSHYKHCCFGSGAVGSLWFKTHSGDGVALFLKRRLDTQKIRFNSPKTHVPLSFLFPSPNTPPPNPMILLDYCWKLCKTMLSHHRHLVNVYFLLQIQWCPIRKYPLIHQVWY